jgi:hypothetical protein
LAGTYLTNLLYDIVSRVIYGSFMMRFNFVFKFFDFFIKGFSFFKMFFLDVRDQLIIFFLAAFDFRLQTIKIFVFHLNEIGAGKGFSVDFISIPDKEDIKPKRNDSDQRDGALNDKVDIVHNSDVLH